MADNKFHELDNVRRYIYSCRTCGVCRYKMSGKVPYVCPVKKASPGFENFSSRGKIMLAQALLEGALQPTDGLARAAYSCTLCGNCMTQCGATDQDTGKPLVDNTAVIEALRADLLRECPDLVDEAYHRVLAQTRQYGNPWGMPRSARGKWAKGLKLKDAQKENADVLLFVGCTMSLNTELSERAKKAAAVLKAAGVDLGILGAAEPCCGSVQKRIGDKELAGEMIKNNINLLNGLGCTTIVTLCAGCCTMLKTEYAQAEVKIVPKVYHLVEYLARLVKDKKIAFTKERAMTVAYHDPCHLGRHLGIFNPPRDILNALPGITLVEPPATRENTICCGAGGGMRLFDGGALAADMGRESLQAAAAAGAQALVSACPFCETNLETAAQGFEAPLPVYDIIDLVYDAVGLSG
jgi:heterodisulfide reductase subunit D